MYWETIPEMERFTFSSHDESMIGMEMHLGIFTANLTDISNKSNSAQVADITSTLTVMISGISNGGTITCTSEYGDTSQDTSSITLILAGAINHSCMDLFYHKLLSL